MSFNKVFLRVFFLLLLFLVLCFALPILILFFFILFSSLSLTVFTHTYKYMHLTANAQTRTRSALWAARNYSGFFLLFDSFLPHRASFSIGSFGVIAQRTHIHIRTLFFYLLSNLLLFIVCCVARSLMPLQFDGSSGVRIMVMSYGLITFSVSKIQQI